ncbi:hypothetical protein [Bradyrhizobium sp. USDA 4454]
MAAAEPPAKLRTTASSAFAPVAATVVATMKGQIQQDRSSISRLCVPNRMQRQSD